MEMTKIIKKIKNNNKNNDFNKVIKQKRINYTKEAYNDYFYKITYTNIFEFSITKKLLNNTVNLEKNNLSLNQIHNKKFEIIKNKNQVNNNKIISLTTKLPPNCQYKNLTTSKISILN